MNRSPARRTLADYKRLVGYIAMDVALFWVVVATIVFLFAVFFFPDGKIQ